MEREYVIAKGEALRIGDTTVVAALRLQSGQVKLGITSQESVSRAELLDKRRARGSSD